MIYDLLRYLYYDLIRNSEVIRNITEKIERFQKKFYFYVVSVAFLTVFAPFLMSSAISAGDMCCHSIPFKYQISIVVKILQDFASRKSLLHYRSDYPRLELALHKAWTWPRGSGL